MFGFSRRMFLGGGFGTLWCSLLHNSTMWPIRDHYECRTCGRRHRVPWAEPERTRAAAHPAKAASIARIRAGAGAVDGGVGHALTAHTAYRVELLCDGGSAGAFVASQTEGARWSEEIFEVEASLPKLKKTACLNAIRRL